MVIDIEDRVPKSGRRAVISDNADLEILFIFDEEWNGVQKVARFVLEDKTYKDVLLVDDKCTIPLEVCRPGRLLVGVIGGDMVTSSFDILVQPSIVAKSDEILDDVSPDVLVQLLKFLKSLDEKPTYEGSDGERVWNSNAKKGDYAGWIYSDGEWLGFGIVGSSASVVPAGDEEDPESETSNGVTVYTSDGYKIYTSDGYLVMCKEEEE